MPITARASGKIACAGKAKDTAVQLWILQLLQQLVQHLFTQLPEQLRELLNQLRKPDIPENLRTFGLDWASEILKLAQDRSAVYSTIFSSVLSTLTTDSTAKLRCQAAKCLLEIIPACSNAVQAHASLLAAAACLGLADVSQDVTKDCERLLSSIAPVLALPVASRLDSPHDVVNHGKISAMPLVRHAVHAEPADPEEVDLAKHRWLVHWEGSNLDLGSEAMQQLLGLFFDGLDAQRAPAGPRRPVRQLMSCWRMATEPEETDEAAKARYGSMAL